MRFYTFDFSEIDILPSQGPEEGCSTPRRSPVDDHLAADFTRQSSSGTRKGATFDGEALSQVAILPSK